MRRTAAAVAAMGLLAGCATTGAAGSGERTERQKISNQSYFDLANCSPRAVEVPKPASKESIIGYLVSARPQVMECMVDPAHRGPAKESKAVITATVSDSGVAYDVQGDNLTPAGTTCIKSMFEARKGLEPLAKGAAPVSEKAEFQHAVGLSNAVAFGNNEASDIVGTIRLNQKNWCECYTDWATKPPHLLKSTVKLARTAPTEVTFEPANDATADKVAGCLKNKIVATKFDLKSDNLTVPYSFILVHSGVSEELAGLPNDVKFVQLEQLRAQRAADSVIAYGARQNAATSYDTLVQKYQKTKDFKLVKDLEAGCAALGRANDSWITALNGQLDVDKRTLTLISSLKATDSHWGDAEAKAQESVALTQKDVTEAEKIKVQNASICPKKRY